MYQCPITYFTDNLIFNIDRSVWAAYKIVGYDYDFLDDNLKVQMLYKMARFLSGITSDAQILIVPVEQDSKDYFRQLKEVLDKDDPLHEQAIYHATQTESYLEQMQQSQGEANDYRSYILVKLADYAESEIITGIKSAYHYFIKDPINALNVMMNLDTKDILMSKLNDAIKAAEKWFYSQNQKVKLVELDSNETQWLYRRMAFRGLKRVKLFQTGTGEAWKPRTEVHEVGSERIIKTYGKDVVNLFSGSIHTENRMIRVEHDKNRISYQTFLALTNIPDSYEYPGMEWIYMLQRYNMQAEVCIHIKSIETRTAQKKLDGKKREIESQIEHITEANADVPDDLLESQEYADALEAELKGLREPLLNTSVTICLASDNKDELERRVTTVKNEYENMNFIIEQPLADQVSLFMQCVPTVGCIVKDYVMPMTPLTLASGVIGASHELGDKRGPYIGFTGAENKQVYLYLGLACLRNMSAAATFFGNLGTGKSFNANLLMVLTVLYGGYGLIFDPKAERSHWKKDLQMLHGMITTVTLSGKPENKGKLDPYNLYGDDKKEADELAINVLSELLKIAPTSVEYTAILEAQKRMDDDKVPSMRRLIELLGSFSEDDELYHTGRFLSRRLWLQADAGMAQLIFGDGSEEAISLDNRLNILQIDNLKLPSPETPKDNYTAEENLSTVLFAIISNFAKKFAMVKRPVFKLILFDESWMLGKTIEGVKLYDFLTRMGRSLFAGCIFNGHSVLDLPSEGIKNTISYKFCFRTNSDSEAERMCLYMDMEPTPANKEVFKNLGNGECMFQDLDRHIGILRFDAVFQDLIDVFSTTPKTEKRVELPETIEQEPEEKELSNPQIAEIENAVQATENLMPKKEPERKKGTAAAETEDWTEGDLNLNLDFEIDEDELYRKEIL